MINTHLTKEVFGLRYCTGNHPEIRQHFRKNGRPSEFGNKVWATSLVLLEYLQSQPFPLQGLRVLEVGCGWGLLGVFFAKHFSCDVTCTDFDECVLPVVELHAKLNAVKITTQSFAFADHSVDFLRNFDLILGAEICYSEAVSKDVMILIDRAAQAGVKRILIADPGRPNFQDCCEYSKKSFDVSLIALPGCENGKTTQLLSAQKKISALSN